MTPAGPDEDRLARAGISHVVDPGSPPVHEAVRRHGATAVWQVLRDGRGGLGLNPDLAGAAAARAVGLDPGRALELAAVAGARLVVPSDDEWPAHRLTWVSDDVKLQPPPLALWVRGDLPLDQAVETSVALVGARAASSYGVHVATELARALAEAGWSVVSGGAYGIDVAAHRGALLARAAPTVAVLASGVDVAYPRGNDRDLARVAAAGLIVSEVPAGSRPQRWRFLARNRLIAALSVGTVVVEAALRSGSLATVDRAETLGRRVMAVPGPVTSLMSAGCHQRIRAGAVCVTGVDDVLEQVGRAGEHLGVAPRGPVDVRDGLPETVRRVLDAVPVRGGAGVAVLARDAGVPVLVVQQVMPPLLTHGLVERTDLGWRLTPLGTGRSTR